MATIISPSIPNQHYETDITIDKIWKCRKCKCTYKLDSLTEIRDVTENWAWTICPSCGDPTNMGRTWLCRLNDFFTRTGQHHRKTK